MSYRIIDKSTIRVEDRKRVPAERGIGFTHVADGHSDVLYVVEISEEGLREIARKAAKNRNGMSVDGPLRVRVLKREKVKE